jgi:SAM-dependent methyltransferase
MTAQFPWPAIAVGAPPPRWVGDRFAVGNATTRILSYSEASSHWSDDLTTLHETEAGSDHPIDVLSRNLAAASMRLIPHSSSPTVLDVGCSSGFVIESLRQNIPDAVVIGADYIRGPLESLARRIPDVPLLQFDLRKCPLPDACVDGITCLNVLEHIDDDASAMRHMHRILKPSGILHVEVPAGPALYDIYDEHLMHHRRYRRTELLNLAIQAGFKVRWATHIGFVVFPGFWWVKRRNKRKLALPPEEKKRIVGAQIRDSRSSIFLKLAMRLESVLGHFVRFPFGIRCVAVLVKS